MSLLWTGTLRDGSRAFLHSAVKSML